MERKIREELIAREVQEAKGKQFRLAVISATRWTLDTGAVKSELGQDWYDRHCKASVTVTLRTAPLAAPLAKAA